MQSESSLQVKNTYQNILKIALPISIAILIPQLNILTNTLFLGYYQPSYSHFTTQDLLAASGLAGIYYLTIVMVDYGLVSGILMMMSRKAGEDDRKGVGLLFSNGLLLCIGLSLLLMFISFYFAPWLFKATIHEQNVQEAAISFIKIRLWGLPFMVVCQMTNSFFLSLSKSKLIMVGTIVQTVVNILFDYLLIFGIGIFPEMGIEGTALASVISEFSYMVVAMSMIHLSKSFYDFSLRYFKNIDWVLMKQMFIKSSPLIIQYFLSIGAWEVFFIYVEHLGKTESALSQIFRSVFGLVGVAAWALGSTCNSMVSNLIGQHALDDVIPLIKKIILISFLVALVIGLPVIMFPRYVLGLLTNDQHLVETGITSLRIVVVATWMLSVATIIYNAVVGTGNTKMSMVFEFVAIIFYVGYITVVIEIMRLPLPFAWLSEFVYWFSLFTLGFLYFYTGRWKKGLTIAKA
ncbi:MAG TPA: MATE family efflux transporter [Chitinophagaceae bacterium]|nr:MATE family efflux transporter [Chitinophagaceae bacterium]